MSPEQATALRKPFPAESVGKLPKGGVMLDYVGHAAVTDRLLTVDPEWSWRPFTAEEILALPPGLRDAGLWIHLTVCGTERIGVGDGKSAKECIGDAIRNAAMRFGVALDLWAKENLVEFEQAAGTSWAHDVPLPPDPPPVAPPVARPAKERAMTAKTRGMMFALFGQKGVAEADQLPGINHITGKAYTSRADLTQEDAQKVIATLEQRPDVAEPDVAFPDQEAS